MNNIYTIGFTGKNAEAFFNMLKNSGAERIVDIRLNNVSQLAAFSKRDDLKYFLKAILNWEYLHKPELAPDEDILKNYKKRLINWETYEKKYLELLDNRNILSNIKKEEILNGVLLCSEPAPAYCHRRLLAEYFRKYWGNINIVHLQ